MSFLVAAPEFLASAATDLSNIGSTLSAANAGAAAPTTGVLAAGADEVSAAIAALFGSHAQAYQAMSAKAAAFHAQFVQLLNAGAGEYAAAEAANASPLQTVAQGLQSLAVFSPVKDLTGRPLFGNGANGAPLSGANNYTYRFQPGQLPPVNAFWSLTMYQLPSSLLVANPINRYLINSPMLNSLSKDPDGGITLYVQNSSPGPGKEANWLPAPQSPFRLVLRLYWPRPEALNGQWKAPRLQKV